MTLRTDLKRDNDSNALLNVDNASLAAYRAARDRDNQINKYIKDVDNLKQDVTEIKDMLKALLNGS